VLVVFGEDFDVGAAIEGVRFVNSLSPEFEIEAWLL